MVQGFRGGFNPVQVSASKVVKKTFEGTALAYMVLAVLAYGFRVIAFPAWVPAPYRLDFLEKSASEHLALRIVETSMFGFTFGGMVGLLLISLPVYLVAMFSGMISAITAGITDGSVQAATPRGIIKDDLIANLAIALTTGAATGLVSGIAYDLGAALAIGWLVFVISLLGVGRNAGRRYLAFATYSALSKQLPPRLGTFMDWATTAGLLRYSGPAYQFRHRELQQWLTQNPPADQPTG